MCKFFSNTNIVSTCVDILTFDVLWEIENWTRQIIKIYYEVDKCVHDVWRIVKWNRGIFWLVFLLIRVYYLFNLFQYGLYSTIMPCFLYILLGGCKDMTLGPTAIMALMTYPHASKYGPAYSVLLCFLSGVIIMLLSILQLGKWHGILVPINDEFSEIEGGYQRMGSNIGKRNFEIINIPSFCLVARWYRCDIELWESICIFAWYNMLTI